MRYTVIDAGAVGNRGYLTVKVDGYPGWVVDVVVMPTPTGLAVTDLSVAPWQLTFSGPEKGTLRQGTRVSRVGESRTESGWSELAEDVPPGGIPTRLIRSLNMGQLITLATQELAADAAFNSGAAKRFLDRAPALARQFLTMAEESHSLSLNGPVKRSGRRGNGIDHYLTWAVRYHEKTAAGVGHPIKELADEHDGTTTNYVRDTITDARRRYGLLTTSGQGRAGGQLTPKALDLIAERTRAKEAE